ncbi:MAG: CHAD domain-containing protein [bacterium]|nr:CHAD domain-containing protein [bacterium]
MKALSKYLRKRKSALWKYFELPKEIYTPETFHELRLEVKKQNAFFELVEFCTKDFERLKHFKALKTVFRQAGKVRDLQVEEMMLRDYFAGTELKSYKRQLHKRIEKEKQIYFSMLNPSFVSQLKNMYRSTEPFLSTITTKAAKRYMANRRKKIKIILLKPNLGIFEIHDLRKRIKKYHFNERGLKLMKQNKDPLSSKTLPEILGKWHDCQFVITNLKKTLKVKGVHIQEKRHLEKVILQLSIERRRLSEKIRAVIPTSEFLINGK